MTHHNVEAIASKMRDDIDRIDPGLDNRIRAYTDGLKAARHAVRSDGTNHPALLRAVADAADESTPFDRGWVVGLRLMASALERGDS